MKHSFTKKSISVLLSLLMVLSVFGAAAFTASAADIVVTFDSDGGSPVGAQTIAAGTAAAKPADPTKEDCFFRGWKLPDEYQYYDFKTPLNEATTLTAIWEEGVSFFRDDFQDPSDTRIAAQQNGWSLTDEGENSFMRFSGGADTGYLTTPVFDVSSVKNDYWYMYVEFLYRNPAVRNGDADGHSEIKVKYRFANTDPEDEWRTDSLYTNTREAHDGWTSAHAMLFFYPDYFSYEDIQFGFVTDGNEGIFDIDDINIYCGGHDFRFNFFYDEEADEMMYNKIVGYCENDFCTLHEGLALTINAPEKKYTDDDKSPAATLDGYDSLVFYSGTNLSDEILYFNQETGMPNPLSGPPTDPGLYTASLIIWNANLGLEAWSMDVEYAIGYTLTYGQPISDIVLPSRAFRWGDSVDVNQVLPVGEYTFDLVMIDSEENAEYPLSGVLPVRVVPKPVTVTAKAAEKTEGEADPALAYTAEGLVGDDSLQGELNRAEGEAAGTYAIQQGTVTNENNPNYAITFTGATFTINAKQTPDNPPEDPEKPEDPTNPAHKSFICEMCPMYKEWKDIPYVGWVVSLVHIFVHLAAYIGYIT